MASIKKLRDGLSPDDAKSKEQLDFLVKAANGQLELFRSKFLEKFNNPDAFKSEILPVKMFEFMEEYRVDISEGSSSEVDQIVDSFFKGTGSGLKEGFKKIIKLGFNSILGDSNIGESKIHKWYITAEYGEIIRVDLMSWKYNFSSDQIISKISNAYCFTLTKSFIDNNSLRKSQLRYFIAQSLGLTDLDELMKNEDLKKYVSYLQDSLDESKTNSLTEANYNALRWEDKNPMV